MGRGGGGVVYCGMYVCMYVSTAVDLNMFGGTTTGCSIVWWLHAVKPRLTNNLSLQSQATTPEGREKM